MSVDSLCVTSWRARPVSFVSLMTLYESNYIRLRRLAGDVRRLSGRLVPGTDTPASEILGSPTRRSCDSPISSAMRKGRGPTSGCVIHDARSEASRCARWVRHPGLESIRSQLSQSLGERWLRNMLLNKWLDYCTDRGHGFGAATAVPSGPLHESV
jgi:uncharacterized protein YqiB (DUF1249 family)